LIALLLIHLDYLSTFVLIYTTTVQEIGNLSLLFVILFIGVSYDGK